MISYAQSTNDLGMTNTLSQKAYFFDMDGVLFDSMPNHAIAWEEVMKVHGLSFTARDCYINEGRTGESVIREAMWKACNRDATPEEVKSIYAEKSAYFHSLGEAAPIDGVAAVLKHVQSCGHQIWVVTGSGQLTLIDSLQSIFPSIFHFPHSDFYYASASCGLPKHFTNTNPANPVSTTPRRLAGTLPSNSTVPPTPISIYTTRFPIPWKRTGAHRVPDFSYT